jgi:hypothetical protein
MSNDNEKHLIIHFTDGTQMEVTFPTQVKNSLGALVELLKRALEADKLIMQTDDRVLIVPWSSIKYVDTSGGAAAAALPLGAIKGARIVHSDHVPSDDPT